MPIAFVPEARTKLCLKADEARPPEQRVYFLAKFITCRQLDQMLTLLDEADAAKSHDERKKKWREAMAIGFVGPVDAKDPQTKEPVPCTIEGIEQVLSYAEQWDLVTEYPRAISISEGELKNSASATPASGAESAKAA